MKILVACEWSGRVRDAFIDRGHVAYSCDLESGRGKYNSHLQQDVREILDYGWDMMIAFPPCTYISIASNMAEQTLERRRKMYEGLEFVRTLMDAPIEKIAIENPVGRISTAIRKPDQIIHPCYFGDPYWKKTCLWLKGLPQLRPTRMCRAEAIPWVNAGGHNSNGMHRNSKKRGLTFPGIALAMAEQWG